MKKIELLAPAGDLEKFITAVKYGADAVYFGGEMFSLRAGAGNLTFDDMKEGLEFAHLHKNSNDEPVKCYLTVNIFAHNEDILPLREYLTKIKTMGEENPLHRVDGFIVSDPGIVSLIKEIIPEGEIHLSTQANMTNYQTAKFWYDFGVKRIVLARELSFKEIRELRENTPDDLEFEAFIHGAMCISYSGRCLLSNFMIQRDANHGECAHPCRWKYALVEEQRPGEYFPIEEDERGTYILNSKDLCMIEYIPKLIECGLSSLKIEGRMKSPFYVATIVSAYRKAINAYYESVENGTEYVVKQEWIDEMSKVSHRKFTTGFYFKHPDENDQNYESSQYIRDYTFTGVVKSYDENTGYAIVEQRNKMSIGDEIEITGPFRDTFTQILEEMYDEEGNPIESCPHPKQIIKVKMDKPVSEDCMIRKSVLKLK